MAASSYGTAQLELDTCIHHTYVFSIDSCMLFMSCLLVLLHMIKMTHQSMRILQANIINVNLDTRASRRCSAQTLLKRFIQCICTSINGLYDNSVDNSNMAMLSMKPRKWIITLHNHYSLTLIQSAVGILLDSRNAETASKPNVVRVTTILKW